MEELRLIYDGLRETFEETIDGVDDVDNLIADGPFHVAFDDGGDDWIEDAVHGIVEGVVQGEVEFIDADTDVMGDEGSRED